MKEPKPPHGEVNPPRPSESLDVLASTNPAFGALLIYAFAEGYLAEAGSGPELALAFLPLPIAASTLTAGTFAGTTALTGLLEWRARNPELLLELPGQVREAVGMSRRSLIFGLRRGVVELSRNSRLIPRGEELERTPKDPTNLEISRRPFTVATRFGRWCGGVGSAVAIYTCLGMQP
jgi:hypothetical protein